MKGMYLGPGLETLVNWKWQIEYKLVIRKTRISFIWAPFPNHHPALHNHLQNQAKSQALRWANKCLLIE